MLDGNTSLLDVSKDIAILSLPTVERITIGSG